MGKRRKEKGERSKKKKERKRKKEKGENCFSLVHLKGGWKGG